MDLILTTVKKRDKKYLNNRFKGKNFRRMFKIWTKQSNKRRKGFFKGVLDHVKSYFKDKATSQRCLDYHEALLVDSKQSTSLIEAY